MSRKQKIEFIRNIRDEKQLRENVLRILLQKMGYKGVTVTHGPGEHGKDLVFYEVDDKTGTEINYAIVAKHGKLKAGSKADKNNIMTVHSQVLKAFKIPYEDPERKRKVSIHRVWVVTNDIISAHASTEIVNMFEDEKDLYARNVQFFDDIRLLELLDRYWPKFFIDENPFLIDYCNKIERRCRELNELRSFGYSKEVKALMEIFIEPTLIEEKRSIPGERKDKAKKLNREPYKKYRIDEILERNIDVWLVGQPGCGKSTTIRNMVLRLLGQMNQTLRFDQIPVIINFRELVTGNDILEVDVAIGQVFQRENYLKFDINPNAWLEEGKIVVFLDGLDEVPRLNLREKLIDAVLRFKKRFAQVKIIASCRDIGFDALRPKLKDFHIVEILPFNYIQMKKFAEKWFDSDKNIGKKMLESVKKALLSGRLPKTPMVLTLLAILFEEKTYQELPANLTELYSMFTELLLGRWDVQRNIESMFDYNIKSNILKNLAYHMHMNELDAIGKEELRAFISEYDEERKVGIDTDKLISEIEKRSGLLFCEGGKYYFKHISFQEFFVSQNWIMMGGIDKEIPQKILDPWWQNVVFFYAGSKKDAPKLIDEIIQKATPKDSFERMAKCLNLGQLLQAAYLTKHSKKVEAIEFVIREYWDTIEEIWQQYKESKLLDVSRFFFLYIMKHFFRANYSSVTLQEAMSEVFRKRWTRKKKIDEGDIFQCYLLAYSLAVIEVQEYFLEIAEAPTDIHPVLLPMVDIDMFVLDNEFGAKFDNKIVKKIRKRIKIARDAIVKYL